MQTEFFQKSNNELWSYSDILEKNIKPSNNLVLGKDNCFTIDDLLFLQSKPTSVMILTPYCLEKLTLKYENQEFANLSLTDWYWQYHLTIFESDDPIVGFFGVLVDNKVGCLQLVW